MTATPIRLYVGTYHKYNCGSIKGAWLDLRDYPDKESFLSACANLHSDEQDPELMFQDFDGFPRAFYSECSVSEKLFVWVHLDNHNQNLVAAYIEATGCDANKLDFDDARAAFAGTVEDNEDEGDFAQRFVEETGAIPTDLPEWIVTDWEATWDRKLRFDFHTPYRDDEGTLWFFHAR